MDSSIVTNERYENDKDILISQTVITEKLFNLPTLQFKYYNKYKV
jgi:hypothetical protein